MFYNMLERDNNSPTRGGFRRSLKTLNHLATYRLLDQKGQECGVKMWIATVFISKASETIRHDAQDNGKLLQGSQSTRHPFASGRGFFADEQATVLTDTESDVIERRRGTKQEDPVSSLLSNTVLQAALEHDLKSWRVKGMDISLGDHQMDCLSNLRVADDVL